MDVCQTDQTRAQERVVLQTYTRVCSTLFQYIKLNCIINLHQSCATPALGQRTHKVVVRRLQIKQQLSFLLFCQLIVRWSPMQLGQPPLCGGLGAEIGRQVCDTVQALDKVCQQRVHLRENDEMTDG